MIEGKSPSVGWRRHESQGLRLSGQETVEGGGSSGEDKERLHQWTDSTSSILNN